MASSTAATGILAEQLQQSDIQIEEVTKDTQCGFCGLTLDEMQQPRALPCGHVHCTECIQVNYQHKEIECKTCKLVLL